MNKLLTITKKVLQWLNPAEFMNTYQEWHAFVEGVSEGFCPWDFKFEPNAELKKDIEDEHHYYVFGIVIGFAAFIFAIAGAIRLVLTSIL